MFSQILGPPLLLDGDDEAGEDVTSSEDVLELDDVTRHPCMQTLFAVTDELNAKRMPPARNEVLI
jgi:hypothetical protein